MSLPPTDGTDENAASANGDTQAVAEIADRWLVAMFRDVESSNCVDEKAIARLESTKTILSAAAEMQVAVLVRSMQLEGDGVWQATVYIQDRLFARKLPITESDLVELAAAISRDEHAVDRIPHVVKLAEQYVAKGNRVLNERLVEFVIAFKRKFRYFDSTQVAKLNSRIDRLVSPDKVALSLQGKDEWAKAAIAELKSLPADQLPLWSALLDHCQTARTGKPTAKWQLQAAEHVGKLASGDFEARVLRWFPLFDVWAPDPEGPRYFTPGIPHPVDEEFLKGLLWCTASSDSQAMVRAVGAVAVSAYRKLKGVGSRAVKIGNAAVWSLGQMPLEEAVGQLAFLRIKVKNGTAQKGIEKALDAAAERLGITREEIEELGVPTYGLTDVGSLEQQLGDFTARLTVSSTSKTELVWVKCDGKTQKSVPAAVKEEFTDEIKEIKAAAKSIQKMLPAQRDRIDTMFLQQKSWPLKVWQDRYLNHPLIGSLARRIIWRFTSEHGSIAGCWLNETLVNVNDGPMEFGQDTTVELWHPIDEPTEDVLAWRDWLVRHEVQQPFKQAHREIYVLTDAERNTNTYSNRFAAHILRQHQLKALCSVRDWKYGPAGAWDGGEPSAVRCIHAWEISGHYWIEPAFDDEIGPSGFYNYVSTDQVRFHKFNETEPMRMEEVPPLVFSEIMRDVDLFVGVSSVGNNPEWADGGVDARFQTYWQNYSFGELSGSASTRKQVLERLIPRLKIADRCSFDDRSLVVQGDIRSYKIHLGSGNILMTPNDQYLCIVPDASMHRKSDKVFLPFEGDRTLSIVLSKAIMLAEDTKIKDSSIVSQIGKAK